MNHAPADVLFRVDASPAIGSGHFMRCLALAQALVDSGLRITWLAAELSEQLEHLLADEDIHLVRVKAEVGSDDDAQQTVAQSEAHNARWIVLDGYRLNAAYRLQLAQARARVLFIDDQGTGEPIHADLVLNQNLHAREQLYPQFRKRSALLLGPRHVLLRRSLRQARPRTPEQRSRGRNLLVIAGGSDPQGLCARVLGALVREPPDLELTVVLGSRESTAHLFELERLASLLRASVLENVQDMSATLDLADLSISAAGSTTWELMHFGIPSLLVSVADNQRPIASSAGAAGAARDLGWHSELCARSLLPQLRELTEDRDRRQEMGERARKLVDGHGCQRVITEMELAGVCAT
ncbi:MAG: UDP-2,4-diacetamido-2,4,6-trideoxy-beta-L-altropyranose hydrolase [Pseudomonadota bacterium]